MLRCLLHTSGSLAGRAVRGVGVATEAASFSKKMSLGAVLSSSSCALSTSANVFSRGVFASVKANTQPTPTTLLASARASLETLGVRGGCHRSRGGGGGSSLARQQQQQQRRRPTLTRALHTTPPPASTRRLDPQRNNVKSLMRLEQQRQILRGTRGIWSRPAASGRGGGDQPSVLNTLKRVGAALVLPFVVAWKYKMAVLSALKLTKLSSLASLALTTAGYAMVFGVPYGVGVTAQILIHESGHALALMRYGIPFQPMVFVPFMGAYVSHAGTLSAWRTAMVALAGPGAGFLAAAALYAAAVMLAGDEASSSSSRNKRESSSSSSSMNFREKMRLRKSARDGDGEARNRTSQLLHALADFGCMINLFNLLPLGSLDGGQVAATLHPSLLVFGCVAGTAMVYQGEVNNPIVYLILLGGYYQVAARFLGWETPSPKAVNLSPRGKAMVAGAYVGLAMALAGLMSLNQARLYGPRGEEPGVALRQDSPYAAEFDKLVNELPDI